MRPDKPLYIDKLWIQPTPTEVLCDPEQPWRRGDARPQRPLHQAPASSAKALLEHLLAHTQEALQQAKVGAVFIGTARGEIGPLLRLYDQWQARGMTALRPFPETTHGALASYVAAQIQCSGPAITLSQTCISGLAALHQAALFSWVYDQPACFGAVEAPLHSLLLESFTQLRLYSRHERFPYVRPFSGNSLALAEGVALGIVTPIRTPWLMEQIVVQSAVTKDRTFTGIHSETFRGLLRALSSMPPDGVLLHAPGTRQGDIAEITAIEAVWGRLPVLTLKPLLGHSVGVSGLQSLGWALWLLENRYWLYDEGDWPLTPPAWPTFPAVAQKGPFRVIAPEVSFRRLAILNAGFGGGVAGVILRYAPL